MRDLDKHPLSDDERTLIALESIAQAMKTFAQIAEMVGNLYATKLRQEVYPLHFVVSAELPSELNATEAPASWRDNLGLT